MPGGIFTIQKEPKVRIIGELTSVILTIEVDKEMFSNYSKDRILDESGRDHLEWDYVTSLHTLGGKNVMVQYRSKVAEITV